MASSDGTSGARPPDDESGFRFGSLAAGNQPPPLVDLSGRDPFARVRFQHGRGSRAGRGLGWTIGGTALYAAVLFGLWTSAVWRWGWLPDHPLIGLLCLGSVIGFAYLLRAWVRGRLRRPGGGRAFHLRDHRWSRPYDERGPGKRMLLALVPFVWLLFQVPNLLLNPELRANQTLSATLLLLLAPFVAWVLYRLHGLFWAGRVRVRFEPFPMRPGKPASIRIGIAERATAPERILVRLVSFRERRHTFWRFRTEVYLQTDTRVELEREDELPAPGSEVEVQLDVPDGPSTHLSADYPTYWELELHVETHDASYVERFLAPVYATEREVGEPEATDETPGGELEDR